MFGLIPLLAPSLLPAAAGRPGPTRAPRTAVAFSPDGRMLALAGYREVALLGHDGRLLGRLTGQAGPVTGVQFSPDGLLLAACGGEPGRQGEIRLWRISDRTSRTLKPLHTDVVYSVCWNPDGKSIAACSYDRLVSVWEIASGTGRALRDHTDAVYSVTFSPDGRRLASASGDRTVKVWDPAAGRRLYTLSDSTAELYSVAFNPSGDELAAGGADRMLRTWRLASAGGTLARSAFAHEAAVLRVLYTRTGNEILTTSEDRSVKLWNAADLTERKVFERQPDWPLGAAVTADGSLLAVCCYDGTAALYDTMTGERHFRMQSFPGGKR